MELRTGRNIDINSASRLQRLALLCRIGIIALMTFVSGCIHYASLPPMVTQDTAASTSLLITNARIFDGNAQHPVLENMDILIENSRIARLGNHPLNATAAKTIAADGLLVMPGLIDFHTHVGGTDAPPWYKTIYPPSRTLSAFLAHGVTSVVDMGGIPGQLQDLRDELESGEIAGPRLAYAGRQVTVADGHPEPLIDEAVAWPLSVAVKKWMVDEVTEETDFTALVQDRRDQGASLVKIMIDRIPLEAPAISAALSAKVVAAAHQQGLPVAAHIGTEEDMLTGLSAGVDFFAHSVNNSNLSATTLKALQQAGTPVISTLRVFQNVALVSGGVNPVTAADALVMDADAAAAFNGPSEVSPTMSEWGRHIAGNTASMFAGCHAMREAGIPMLLGTDTPLLGASAGSSTHVELNLLVERCGFSPLQALALATGKPGAVLAQWLQLPGLGTVSEGAPADLLIMNGDPTQQIDEISQIRDIISRGRIISRTPL